MKSFLPPHPFACRPVSQICRDESRDDLRRDLRGVLAAHATTPATSQAPTVRPAASGTPSLLTRHGRRRMPAGLATDAHPALRRFHHRRRWRSGSLSTPGKPPRTRRWRAGRAASVRRTREPGPERQRPRHIERHLEEALSSCASRTRTSQRPSERSGRRRHAAERRIGATRFTLGARRYALLRDAPDSRVWSARRSKHAVHSPCRFGRDGDAANSAERSTTSDCQAALRSGPDSVEAFLQSVRTALSWASGPVRARAGGLWRRGRCVAVGR